MVKLWISASSTSSKSETNFRRVVITVSCRLVTCWSLRNVTLDSPQRLELLVWDWEPIERSSGQRMRRRFQKGELSYVGSHHGFYGLCHCSSH